MTKEEIKRIPVTITLSMDKWSDLIASTAVTASMMDDPELSPRLRELVKELEKIITIEAIKIRNAIRH